MGINNRERPCIQHSRRFCEPCNRIEPNWPTRVTNVKYHRFDVYVGQRMPRELYRTGETDGVFGNKFHHLKDFDSNGWRAWVKPYVDYLFARLQTEPKFFAAVQGLHGKALGCWCKNVDLESPHQPLCHGDILKHVTDWMHREFKGYKL